MLVQVSVRTSRTGMQNFVKQFIEKKISDIEASWYTLWQYGLGSFQMGYTKLERFLHKNQHTQGKLLNFENWTNGEPQ